MGIPIYDSITEGEISTHTLTEAMGGIPMITFKYKPPYKLYKPKTYTLQMDKTRFKYKKGFMFKYTKGFISYLLIDPSDFYDYYEPSAKSKDSDGNEVPSRGEKLGDDLESSIKSLCSNSFEVAEDDCLKTQNESKLKFYRFTGTRWQKLVNLCNSVQGKLWGIRNGSLRFFDRVVVGLEGRDNIITDQGLTKCNIDHSYISDTYFELKDTDNLSIRNLRAGKSINLPIPSLANSYVDFSLLRAKLEHSIYDTRPYAEVSFSYLDSIPIEYSDTDGFNYRFVLGQIVVFTSEDYLMYNFPFTITQVSYEFTETGHINYFCKAQSFNYQHLYSSINNKAKDGGGKV